MTRSERCHVCRISSSASGDRGRCHSLTAGTVITSFCRTSGYASRIEHPSQSGPHEVTHPAGGAEDLDACPVRKEERPELENLVISGEELRRHSARSAETGDEGRREPEAADLCDAPPHEFNVTNEMDQELQHLLISRTEREALEVVRGPEREPGLEQWRRLPALYDSLAAGRSLDDSRQILSPPKAVKNRPLLTHHPSLRKSRTTPPRTHRRPVA